MEAGWLAAVAIIPLFFNASSIQTFEPGKSFVLKSLALISGAAWLLRRIDEGGLQIGQQFKSLMRKPLVFPVFILAGVYLVSSALSVAPHLSWWGAYYEAQGTATFLCYAVFFLIVLTELRSPDQVNRLQYTIVLTSIPVAGYAVTQRFGGDPFRWEDAFDGRSGGSMGNPIFLGGYLIMVIPLTFCRLIDGLKVFRSVSDRRPVLVRACFCGLALVLQVLALLYTESRGPLLGLAVAGYFCLSIYLILSKSPRQSGAAISVTPVLLGVFIPVLALAAVLLASRFFPGHVFACLEVVVAIIAILFWSIWKTAWGRSWLWLTFLVQPLVLSLAVAVIPANIAFRSQGPIAPFGRITQLSDPGVKYREGLWETGARFLKDGPKADLPDGTPDSYHVLRSVLGYGPECTWFVTNTLATPSLIRYRFQESENRMHNEIFDDLITTGYAGTVAYLILVASAFYYSLQFVGFSFERRARIGFVVLAIIGVLAGLLIPWMAGIPQFIGLGITVGLLAGIFASILWSGIRSQGGVEISARQLLVLGILGALTAHFIEISVAVSVTSTRVYFYLYLALIAVCCSGDWVAQEQPAKRAKAKSLNAEANPWVAFAAIASVIVFVQTWCFTFSPGNETSAIELFSKCWFGTFDGGQTRVHTAVLLMLLTIFAGAALTYAEASKTSAWKSIIGFSALLAGVWLIAGLMSAYFWAGLDNPTPLDYSQHAEARMTLFVFGCLFLIAAVTLILRAAGLPGSKDNSVRSFAVIAGILLIIGAGIGTWRLTLRPAWADIAARTARIYESTGDARSASLLYERAVGLSPQVIQYHFYLGLAQIKAAGFDRIRLDQARATLQEAQALNALDPVVYRTFGTYHLYVGEHSSDPQTRNTEITQAIGYFEKAQKLAPGYPNAYDEKGRCLSLLGSYEQAENVFQRSMQMHPDYWLTYKYRGEMQYRQRNFEAALQSFNKAAGLNPNDLDCPKNAGVLLVLLGRPGEAIRITLEALKKAPNDSMLLANVASWYFLAGDYNAGTDFAKRAYDLIPGASKGSFADYREKLQNKTWN